VDLLGVALPTLARPAQRHQASLETCRPDWRLWREPSLKVMTAPRSVNLILHLGSIAPKNSSQAAMWDQSSGFVARYCSALVISNSIRSVDRVPDRPVACRRQRRRAVRFSCCVSPQCAASPMRALFVARRQVRHGFNSVRFAVASTPNAHRGVCHRAQAATPSLCPGTSELRRAGCSETLPTSRRGRVSR
jgi:hypothetical protein